ncbi:SprT-like family-domain-containing protein [Xylariales sp. PMI_506]|nr:SprT-like family-domain-containing protein [Xylariales sp. PMI_506]
MIKKTMTMYDSDSNSSGNEDFPDLQVVARRARLKAAADFKTVPNIQALKTPAKELKLKATSLNPSAPSTSVVKATPLRRRKLGHSQVVDLSLFHNLSDIDDLKPAGEKSSAARSKATRVRSREVKKNDAVISNTLATGHEDGVSQSSEDEESDIIVRRPRLTVSARQSKRYFSNGSRSTPEPGIEEKHGGLDTNLAGENENAEYAVDLTTEDDEPSSDEASEFVTALSVGTQSESGSDSDGSFITSSGSPIRRPQRTTAKPLLPGSPSKKTKPTRCLSGSQGTSNETSHQLLTAPGTPRVKPRDVPAAQTKKKSTLEDAFEKLKIFAAEDLPGTKQGIILEPVTPKKSLQPTVLKGHKIPPSPWKPEHKEFWDAEIQNEWIDRHSPPKRSPKKIGVEGGDKRTMLKQKYGSSPEKRNAKKEFDQIKVSLAEDFLHELDRRITAGQLAKLTAATGGMQIKWCNTLQSTAGRAHWKCREVTTSTPSADGNEASRTVTERQHEAWIDLASKVLTNEDDLFNTVAHEFCHLAVFMLNGKPKFAHGAEFKAWGRKCMDVFGEERGIVVTTKHNYEIDYKFIWRCVECLTEVKRHSRSVDPERQRCGRCRGVLEQVKPVPRGGGCRDGKERKKTAYQEFVSVEMRQLKSQGTDLNFGEIMAVVAKKWKEVQARANSAKAMNDALDKEVAIQDLEMELGSIDLTS